MKNSFVFLAPLKKPASQTSFKLKVSGRNMKNFTAKIPAVRASVAGNASGLRG